MPWRLPEPGHGDFVNERACATTRSRRLRHGRRTAQGEQLTGPRRRVCRRRGWHRPISSSPASRLTLRPGPRCFNLRPAGPERLTRYVSGIEFRWQRSGAASANVGLDVRR
jgi:hypothetical protein